MAGDGHKTTTDDAAKPRDRTEREYSGRLKSAVEKRSLVVGGHKTSVSLEGPFWDAIREIAHQRNVTLSKLVADIDNQREYNNLSSAIRLFVFDQYCERHR